MTHRKLLIQSMMLRPQVAMNEIRILYPNLFLQTIPGVRTLAVPQRFDLKAGQINEEKIAIIQRIHLDIGAIRQLIDNNYVIVYELDDLPLATTEHENKDFLYLRAAHALQTSTIPLATALHKLGSTTEKKVFENQLAALPSFRTDATDKITIFFGALNREKEYDELLPTINKLAKQFQASVQFSVIHDQLFYSKLETPNKTYIPHCNYKTYNETLRKANVALLPLTDTPFNRCKSDLKFIECAAHGVVCIASPTVYSVTIKNGKTGFIYESPEEFESHLIRLINDRRLLHNVMTQAYQYVAKERLMAYHYMSRYEWYCSLLDNRELHLSKMREVAPEIFKDWEPSITRG